MSRIPTISGGVVVALGGCARDQGAGQGQQRYARATAAPVRDPGGASGGTGVQPDGGVTPGGCQNLQCQQTSCTQGNCVQHACPNGEKTTLSGTVFDPGGRTPLYNAIVYVPNADLAPITDGVSCDQRCNGTATGSPIASALTDATGHFTLDNAPGRFEHPAGESRSASGGGRSAIPYGDRVPGQPGRRREPPRCCACRPIRAWGTCPGSRSRPATRIALDCLMRKIPGVAMTRSSRPTRGPGRIHMFVGGAGSASNQGSDRLASTGATFADAYATLYASYTKLAQYDIPDPAVRGLAAGETAKTPPLMANIRRYADNGGRIFDEHLNSYWISNGLPPPWPDTASYIGCRASTRTIRRRPADHEHRSPRRSQASAGARRLAAGGAGDDHAGGPDRAGDDQHRRAALGRYGAFPPSQRWIYRTDHNPNAVQHEPRGRVPDVQHAGRGADRQSGAAAWCSPTCTRRRRPACRTSAPGAPGFPSLCSPDPDHVGAGKGARVHVLRSVVVRAAREGDAGTPIPIP